MNDNCNGRNESGGNKLLPCKKRKEKQGWVKGIEIRGGKERNYKNPRKLTLPPHMTLCFTKWKEKATHIRRVKEVE